MRRATWREDFGVWHYKRGRAVLAAVYQRADGWHATIFEQRRPGAWFGWIGEFSGVFSNRRRACKAVVRLVKGVR